MQTQKVKMQPKNPTDQALPILAPIGGEGRVRGTAIQSNPDSNASSAQTQSNPSSQTYPITPNESPSPLAMGEGRVRENAQRQHGRLGDRNNMQSISHAP
jgi:hypothetical protein